MVKKKALGVSEYVLILNVHSKNLNNKLLVIIVQCNKVRSIMVESVVADFLRPLWAPVITNTSRQAIGNEFEPRTITAT